ncbi:MAG: hypothetical protein ACFHX7_22445 [Pseudomonadota bacterium]
MPSPSMPSPSMPDPGSSRQQGDRPGEQGKQGEQTAQQSREKAGSDLEKAGQQVASAGEKIGEAGEAGASGSNEPPEFPVDPQAAGQGEPDTLTPDSDAVSSSDQVAWEDEPASTAAAGDAAAGEPAAGEPAAADAAAADAAATEGVEASSRAGADTASADGMGEPATDPWLEGSENEAIAAAQAAMIEAGIKLQEAGAAVGAAETDAELARAQELLAEARVILIVAGQDLISAREAAGDGESEIFDAADDALNNATVAVVIATEAVMGLPDFGDLQTAGIPAGAPAQGGRVGELEDELEQSLIVFDGQILEARTVLMPGPESGAGLPGSGTGMPSNTTNGVPRVGGGESDAPVIEDTGETVASGESSGANSVGNAEMASSENADSQVALIPDDVGTGQNDDIVAQQLREAAVAETDPELREKLWQEYRRYKSGL